ncbi:MAG: DUF4124 domain-containing protein [Azoarcus sp.]|nr:DUF4124 domain-containing protein [Azoarcus sp.]
MKRFACSAALVFGLVAALSAYGEIYKWKDKDGKVHFSDMPPTGQSVVPMQKPKKKPQPNQYEAEPEDAEAVEEGLPADTKKAAEPAPVPKTQAERDEEFRKRRAAAAEAKEKADKEAADAARRKEECRRARAQYAVLSSGQRVARPSEEGGRVFLDDKSRAAEIERAQELVSKLCDGK